jgi:hypothetical protein
MSIFSGKAFWLWAWIAVVVIAILAVIQVLRVNPPAREPSAGPPVVRYTDGTVIDGQISLPAGDILSYPIRLNRTAYLKGEFKTGGQKVLVECLVLDPENFVKWKQGNEPKTLVRTSKVPAGLVNRRLEAGEYHLVFDNRHSSEQAAKVTVSFSVD